MKHLWRIGLCGVALLAGSSAPALATTITFEGSGTGVEGAALAARAIFDFTGNTLTVTLTNIATSDNTSSNKDVPGNTLTGVFFDLTGSPTLTPMSATIPGQIVQFELCDAASCEEETNVGGEFRYGTGAFPGGAGQGIASSGYVGGPSGNFGGLNLDDPNAPDGINFGILSNDPSYLPNGGLENDPLLRNQVVFILTGVDRLSVDDISNVSFQYGTNLTEPNISGDCVDCTEEDVPEPTTLMLLGCGLATLGLYRRRPRARA